jgi:CheY-like chemotaxis protein
MTTPISILLIEDDEDDQEFFREALREVQDVTLLQIASDGQEAIDTLTNSIILPEIIFMDVDMPRMNGIECLREISNNPRIRNVPIVMLTSCVAHRELSLNLGARAFIKKPPDGRDLSKKLIQIVNREWLASTHAVLNDSW